MGKVKSFFNSKIVKKDEASRHILLGKKRCLMQWAEVLKV